MSESITLSLSVISNRLLMKDVPKTIDSSISVNVNSITTANTVLR